MHPGKEVSRSPPSPPHRLPVRQSRDHAGLIGIIRNSFCLLHIVAGGILKNSSTSGAAGSSFAMATSAEAPAKEAQKRDSQPQKQKRETQGEAVRDPKPGAGGSRSIFVSFFGRALGLSLF
jgi:hypothetical protein